MSSIGKGAMSGILPRNQKPDMLLGKAGTTHKAKPLSPSSRLKLTAFFAI